MSSFSKPIHRIIPLGFLLGVIVLALSGCDAKPARPWHYTGATMGTYYSVKVVNPVEGKGSSDIVREFLAYDIERILTGIEDSMSTYREESELSRFNAATSTDWFPISRDLYTVVAEALEVSRLTDGAFDVTVGPLVNLWGFGPPAPPMAPDGQPPVDEVAVRGALARIGYQKIRLRANPPAIAKKASGVYVDLSAIAKGFAVDKIAQYLERKGISGYLVDIGGELRAKGTKPDGKPWRVAIEKPTPGGRAVHRVITIDGQAVATSGDYRNYFERDGKRYSHTIDPKTGYPVTHDLASVTIIAPSAMRADALATAFSVLGPEIGYRLARQKKIPAWFISRSGARFKDRHTSAFARFMVEQ
uniref:FAD:protein FMN transferase n=1 Tax=Candidatus Kentrum sp. DK TaxID=2126562 RepID=A0A450TAV7_9GAMM|nr:MAG: thiamine biosynthesis lipoprotein [Candidatus Kentron sp. DK]